MRGKRTKKTKNHQHNAVNMAKSGVENTTGWGEKVSKGGGIKSTGGLFYVSKGKKIKRKNCTPVTSTWWIEVIKKVGRRMGPLKKMGQNQGKIGMKGKEGGPGTLKGAPGRAKERLYTSSGLDLGFGGGCNDVTRASPEKR